MTNEEILHNLETYCEGGCSDKEPCGKYGWGCLILDIKRSLKLDILFTQSEIEPPELLNNI